MNSRHSRSAADVDLVGVTPLLRRLLSPRLRVRIASCVVHDDVDGFGDLVGLLVQRVAREIADDVAVRRAQGGEGFAQRPSLRASPITVAPRGEPMDQPRPRP